MARASTPTLLSLDRYAKILGISPAHFNQAAAINLSPEVFPLGGGCSDIWYQYDWQKTDQISREALARAIKSAEDDIARELGYWPAPKWIVSEPHLYPKPWNRSSYGYGWNVRGQRKGIIANWKKIIAPGQRVNTAIETGATVAYSDPDGDGFSELATITATTTVTDVNEIRLYFAGQSAADEWEIRPVKTKAIAGGTVTITVDSWMLIDPDLWEVYPTTAPQPALVDVTTTSNFVSTVDIYRVRTDSTQTSAVFYWEQEPQNFHAGSLSICTSCGGSGCEVCSLVTQNGCAHIRDVITGQIVPSPGTYDSATAQWDFTDWAECREPDQVKIYYYAGDQDDRYLAGNSFDPLSDFFAYAIAWMATARLERNFCSCNNVQAMGEDLRTDMAFQGGEGGFNVAFSTLDNPFGTRKGEVMAWKRVSAFSEKIFEGAVL